MAKIYETREDLERETLATKIEQGREHKSNLISTGTLMAVAGSTLVQLGSMRSHVAANFTKEKLGFLDKIEKPLGVAGIVVGIAAIITGLLAGKKTKDLEDKAERLGPQQITLPHDLKSTDTVPLAGTGKHTLRIDSERQSESSNIQKPV